jgi:hypothetical protein
MKHRSAAQARVILPQSALTVVFDECDGFDQDETGGRVIGTYTADGEQLTISVTGIIESGPRAQRSPVSFFQDGEHQERIFRDVERQHSDIEHLGNWHTHHVNGLATLSGGDVDTYHRIVNHRNHNTDFLYALLVTAKHHTSAPLHRYSVKHYLFRRGDPEFHEIPSHCIDVVDVPLVWPVRPDEAPKHPRAAKEFGARVDRVSDRDLIQELYEGFRPFASPRLGIYWRGVLELLDGSKLQVVVVEQSAAQAGKYSVALREPPALLREVADDLAQQDFASARAALVATERACNRALFHQARVRGSQS